MHDARQSPRQKLPFGFSIPRHFDSISSLFRHTEAFRNMPYTTNIWILVDATDSHFDSFLGSAPDLRMILMTTLRIDDG